MATLIRYGKRVQAMVLEHLNGMTKDDLIDLLIELADKQELDAYIVYLIKLNEDN